MSDEPSELSESWRREYEILGEVLEILSELSRSRSERARVLLVLILKLMPDAFSDQVLMELVRAGKEPAAPT